MGGAAERAVGAEPGRSVLGRVVEVENRMNIMEAQGEDNHAQLCNKIDGLCDLIGKPANGPAHPPSGLYHLVECVDKRLQPFERLRERVWGAFLVGCPLVTALWWLGGDKIGRLLHGG